MANVCSTSICFYVDSETDLGKLVSLKEDLERVIAEDHGKFSALLPEKCEKISMRGSFNRDIIFNQPVHQLYVSAECDWNPQYDFLNCISIKYGVKWASASDECDASIFEIVGDPDGEIFSHNYSTDFWDNKLFFEDVENHEEGVCYFDTYEDILAFLNTLNTDFTSDSLEEWDEYLSDVDVGHIRIWKRIDGVI